MGNFTHVPVIGFKESQAVCKKRNTKRQARKKTILGICIAAFIMMLLFVAFPSGSGTAVNEGVNSGEQTKVGSHLLVDILQVYEKGRIALYLIVALAIVIIILFLIRKSKGNGKVVIRFKGLEFRHEYYDNRLDSVDKYNKNENSS